MSFYFQSPGSKKLLHEIARCADGAVSGGGIFAFASRFGIDSFLGLKEVSRVIEAGGSFHLIVGSDAITNTSALVCLSEWIEKFSGRLTAEVFYHNNPGSTFHPKVSWFVKDGVVRLLTGSGNLTGGGLGVSAIPGANAGNWEAFYVRELDGLDCADVLKKIDTWLGEERQEGRLRQIEDQEVQDRALENSRTKYVRAVSKAKKKNEPVEEEIVSVDGDVIGEQLVLVREIPKNRPGQADLGKKALEEFFGFSGEGKSVFLQYVSLDNFVGSSYRPKLFSNASQNYRLELPAVADLPYAVGDNDERMIAIVAKMDENAFRYTIVPISESPYQKVSALLGAIKAGNARKMREAYVTADDLRTAWPKVPANLLPINLPALN